MPLEDLLLRHRAVATAIIMLACFALYRAHRGNRLLSGSAGLHASILIFLGIGPLTYTFVEPGGERVPFEVLLASLLPPYTYLLIGYSIAVFTEWLFTRRNVRRMTIPASEIDGITLSIFGGLAIIGYTMSLFEFSLSGIATIFPVLGTFLYPVIVVVVAAYRPSSLPSNVLTLTSLGLSGYFAVFSLWRSQLIMLLVSIGIGAVLRSRKGIIFFVVVALATLYLVLPFQVLKRASAEEFTEAPDEFFYATLEIDFEDRQSIILDFISHRINGAREMSYVQAAIDNGQIESRYGQGYIEAWQQLIPRIFWRDKPSFNQTTGFVLPREIGLVSWSDPFTSWAVNFWAELLWNFSYKTFVFLIPVVFILLSTIDRWIDRLLQQQACAWIAHATLFFLFLQLVSIINLVTYALWLFIIILGADYVLRSRDKLERAGIAISNASTVVR
jgi:hypothetical protein